MKDIRVDAQGRERCWNCGGLGFTQQRTARSKVAFGVGAVLTKKKLRCIRCGEYNDVGNAHRYDGPAARKYRKEWEAEQQQGPVQAPLAGGPPAGFYPDPGGAPVQRWWDGFRWTDHTQP